MKGQRLERQTVRLISRPAPTRLGRRIDEFYRHLPCAAAVQGQPSRLNKGSLTCYTFVQPHWQRAAFSSGQRAAPRLAHTPLFAAGSAQPHTSRGASLITRKAASHLPRPGWLTPLFAAGRLQPHLLRLRARTTLAWDPMVCVCVRARVRRRAKA